MGLLWRSRSREERGGHSRDGCDRLMFGQTVRVTGKMVPNRSRSWGGRANSRPRNFQLQEHEPGRADNALALAQGSFEHCPGYDI